MFTISGAGRFGATGAGSTAYALWIISSFRDEQMRRLISVWRSKSEMATTIVAIAQLNHSTSQLRTTLTGSVSSE